MARAARPTSLWRLALAGAALGLVWAVYARAWMRYVSPDPAFSWSGTGFILGVGIVAGSCLGVVEGARRSGRSRAWRAVGVGGLVVFLGAGSILLPMAALGAVGLAGRTRRWLSVLLLVAAAALTVALALAEPVPHDPVLSAAGLVLMVAGEALALSVVIRRWAVRAPTDGDGEPITLPGARVPSPRRARRAPRRVREPSR